MANKLEFGAIARKKMLKGILTLNNATKVTLGPKGRNVIIEQEYGPPLIINDGVTIAKSIVIDDQFENLGASVMIEAATKTNDVVGDGTTTTILIASTIIEEGIKRIEQGANAITLRYGIEYYLNAILKYIDQVSTPISSINDINKVATISSGHDTIGQIIAKAYEQVGLDGQVVVEETQGLETYLEFLPGYSYDRGFISPYMVNKTDQQKVILEKPLIYVTNKKIMNINEIIPFIESAMEAKSPLLIICDDIEQEVLNTLIINKIRNIFYTVVTKAPGHGFKKTPILEDIALITGATFVDRQLKSILNEQDIQLGSAQKVIISQNQTIIIGGNGEKDRINERISQIKQHIVNLKNDYDKSLDRERISKLLGGIGVIYVGAANELTLKELKLRIEDALNATTAAMHSGIVEGGGKVFYEIADKLYESDLELFCQDALDILQVALKAPFKQIIINSGAQFEQISEKINKDYWYNALTGQIVLYKNAGIIDPTNVIKSIITNAISIASIFLTTECAIIKQNKNDNKLLEEDLI